MSFLGEIRRRKVFQVAAVYAVVAWLIIQIIDVVSEPLSLPVWLDTVVIVLLAVGFPVAVILAWAFDLTPEGVVRDEGTTTTVQSGGRRIEYVFTALLVVAVGTLLYREFGPSDQPVEIVAEEAQREVLPNSVAVLPFENLSLDPEDAFFAAGIHDTILKELAKIQDMNVISRTAMLRYADGQTPIPQIAEELNVQTVMEGSVQYAEGRVLVTAQLIDPQTNAHLWSESYDRPFADIFAIQADVATRIAMALEAELLPREQQIIEERPTDSEAAYRLYLKARALIPNIGPVSPPEFYESLERAVALDPKFALAHATLAFAYGRALGGFVDSGDVAGSVESHEALVRDHAEQALQLDPRQGLADGAIAMLEGTDYRVADAKLNWDQAVELNPKDVEVLDDAAIFYAHIGEGEEAYSLLDLLAELNPGRGGADLWVAYATGDYDTAVTVLREFINANPGLVSGQNYVELGLVEAVRGEATVALEELRLGERLTPNLRAISLSWLAYAYGRTGQQDDAERVLRQLQVFGEDDRFSNQPWPIYWVFAYLGVGDHVQALNWLNTLANTPGPRGGALELRAQLVDNTWNDPILDQPEFVEVRSRLGFRE